jgi:tetratricopeptide (TPR) repeat protein
MVDEAINCDIGSDIFVWGKTRGGMMKYLMIGIVLMASIGAGFGQTGTQYDALVQTGKSQLQMGNPDRALTSGEAAIKLNPERWEAYALAGGALMNLKRYEDAADRLSKAIEIAPENKKNALRDLRKQCALAETSPATAAVSTSTANQTLTAQAAPAATQAEIVLWKSIENSTSTDDFNAYLSKYPDGAFSTLAKSHIERLQEQQTAVAKAREDQREKVARETEYKRYHIPAEHALSWGSDWGYLDITGDGATYSGPEHPLTFSKNDVAVIKTEFLAGYFGLKFILKSGEKYLFFACSEIGLENHKMNKQTAGSPAMIGNAIKEKWGWVLTPNNKELIPGPDSTTTSFLINTTPLSQSAIAQPFEKSPGKEPDATFNSGGGPSEATDPRTFSTAAPSAVLHITRNSSTAGAMHPYIFVDQQRTIEILNRQNVKILLPPGKHTISVGDKDVSESQVPDLVVEAGKEYWIKLSFSVGLSKAHSKLSIESPQSAEAESAKLVEINYGDAFKK